MQEVFGDLIPVTVDPLPMLNEGYTVLHECILVSLLSDQEVASRAKRETAASVLAKLEGHEKQCGPMQHKLHKAIMAEAAALVLGNRQ